MGASPDAPGHHQSPQPLELSPVWLLLPVSWQTHPQACWSRLPRLAPSVASCPGQGCLGTGCSPGGLALVWAFALLMQREL